MNTEKFFQRIGYKGKLEEVSFDICKNFKLGDFVSNKEELKRIRNEGFRSNTNSLNHKQINYINETKPGESLSIQAGCDSNDPYHWYVQGANQSSGLKSFEAALGWVKR